MPSMQYLCLVFQSYARKRAVLLQPPAHNYVSNLFERRVIILEAFVRYRSTMVEMPGVKRTR